MFDASARLPELSTGWQAGGMRIPPTRELRPGQLVSPAGQVADTARFAFALSQADVEEFRELIHRECGEELSPEEAWKRASEVLALFRMLLGPMPEDRATVTYPQA
jgi:hypothetical protein